jgi:cytochrome c-type biogenesis protein CcmH
MSTDIATLRHQLQQLKALHDSGDLGAAIYEQSRADLERKIVEQVMAGGAAAAAKPSAPASRPSWPLLAGVAAAAIALAAAGYWWAGSPSMPSASGTSATDGSVASERSAGASPHSVSPQQMTEMADKLAARLKDKPDDAEGWTMLARSYAVLERHADAVPAYRKAASLRATDAQLLADFADALAVTNNRSLEGEPRELIERALKLEPDNLKALSLAGTAAFNRKDYTTAVRHWTRIEQVAPADSSYLSQVKGSIAEARELGKLPAPAAGSDATSTVARAATTNPAAGASVSGTITLAAALVGQAGPNDTVFVFARPVEGSRMPLAILRKQVKDLPIQFTLDDSLAMSAAAKLSAHKQVMVGARISKSGDAMPQPGDLTGLSEPVAVGVRGLKIEISQTVPK